jgi:hypothetical protein
MIYEVDLVDPKTNEEKTIVVELLPEQAEGAKASSCLQTYVQGVARINIPDGFMPIGGRVRPVTLH